ncbi:hypothetical protein GCM10022221_72730 [Actinocorallia aurea]
MTRDPFSGPLAQGHAATPGARPPESPPPPGPYAAVPPPRPRNGLAIASVALGIVGAACVSLPLAIAALVRARRTGGPGTGLAVTGIVLSALWLIAGSLVGALLFAVVADMKDERPAPGACYNEVQTAGREFTDCTSPHTHQVLSAEEPSGSGYPGDRELERRARRECVDRWYPALLQGPYADDYGLTYELPSRFSWLVDKRVICLLKAVDGKTSSFVDLSAVKVDPARKQWSDLAVGDCFDPHGEDSRTVVARACDRPHGAQVFHAFSLGKGPWPGEERVDERAGSRCDRYSSRFFDEHPPGVLTADSFVSPTRASWARGDRHVLCLVKTGYDDIPLTRSLVP